MDRIKEVMDRMITKCEADRQKAAYMPSEEDIISALQEMLDRGYEPSFDPEATRILATWLAVRRAGAGRRGLLLYGKPGTGKTFFVQCFCDVPIRPAVWYVDLWKKYNWGEYFSERAYGIYSEAQIHIGPQKICIDDLGQEPLGFSFGSREEVLERVICDRYRHWQNSRVKTYFTSNRTLPEIQNRYGRRIIDRVSEMCLLVAFTGKSVRTEI